MITINTRLNDIHYPILNAYSNEHNNIKHHLLHKAYTVNDIKSIIPQIIVEFGVTTRMVDACRIEVEAIIKSTIECLKLNKKDKETRIRDIKDKIHKQNNVITKLNAQIDKQISRKKPNKGKIAEITTKINDANSKIGEYTIQLKEYITTLKNVEYELSRNIPKISFGNFGDQYKHPIQYKDTNDWKKQDYKSWLQYYTQWKKEYIWSRNNNFSIVGRSAENNGNVNFTPIKQDNGLYTFRLRLTNKLSAIYGNYYYITDVDFGKNTHYLDKAILENQSITIRCNDDKKSWVLHISFEQNATPLVTNKKNGILGIDLNNGFITMAILKADGNISSVKDGLYRIDMDLRGKTSEERSVCIGNTLSIVRDMCLLHKIDVSIEDLDFSDLKMVNKGSGMNVMIHSFPYAQFANMCERMCFKNGIGFHKVNAAYTSFIGRQKYMKQMGISVHHSAAICIGRLGLGYINRCISNKEFISDNGQVITVELPVRNVKHSVNGYAKVVKKGYTTALGKISSRNTAVLSDNTSVKTDLLGDITGLRDDELMTATMMCDGHRVNVD